MKSCSCAMAWHDFTWEPTAHDQKSLEVEVKFDITIMVRMQENNQKNKKQKTQLEFI